MIDRPPEIMHLAVDLHIYLVEVPSPMAKAAHRAHTSSTDVASKHRAKSFPPQAHSLMADVDATLEQQILDVPERKREADVHQHYQADHLGGGIEVAERASEFARAWHADAINRAYLTTGAFALTVPARPNLALILRMRGQAYLALDDYLLARDFLDAVIALDPKDDNAKQARTTVLQRLGETSVGETASVPKLK